MIELYFYSGILLGKKGNKTKQIPLNCLGGPKNVGNQFLVLRKAPKAF